MPSRLSRFLFATSLLCVSTGLSILTYESAAAQPKPPAAADAGDSDAVEQIALTEKQIQGLIAAQKDIAAITAKIPESADGPSPKVQAQLDAAAKKNGFASYAEYDQVTGNVGLVLAGFDPETKTFIGPDAVIKKQIADVTADKEMSAKEKKEALDGLNAAAKNIVPVKFPDNIKLVGKYYDKLSDALQQD